MGAAWLLPIVACVVAAASGAIVAEILPDAQYALGTLIASFVLWGVGVPFALMVIVIYLLRLMLHKVPAKAVIVSTFLPLGPLGQGGYGFVYPSGHTDLGKRLTGLGFRNWAAWREPSSLKRRRFETVQARRFSIWVS